MLPLDLPTSDTTSAAPDPHIDRFLNALTELVNILGKVGPGGSSAGDSGTGASQGGQLVKATRKLFNDLAASFKPLKAVLAGFSSIHPTPASGQAQQVSPTTTPPASDPSAQAVLPTPAPAVNLLAVEPPAVQGKPKRQRRPKAEATPPAIVPPAPVLPTPAPAVKSRGKASAAEDSEDEEAALIRVQDASISIENAAVRLPRAVATPAVKAVKPAKAAADTTPAVKPVSLAKPAASLTKAAQALVKAGAALVKSAHARLNVQTAGIKVGNALIKGSFMFPPDFGRVPKTPKAAKTGTPSPASPTPASPVKGTATPAGNDKARDAGEKLRQAIIHIASGVVHVHGTQTGGEEGEDQARPQQQRPQPQRKPGSPPGRRLGAARGLAGAGRAMAKRGTGSALAAKGKAMAGAARGAGSAMKGGGNLRAMADPRAALLMAASKIANAMLEAAKAVTIAAAKAVWHTSREMAKLVGSGVAAPFQAVGSKLQGIGGALANAFKNPEAAFKSFTSTMIGFVNVVNPAAVMVFMKTITDLTAVVGRALAPAMTIATEVVREYANLLAPIMETLTPTITTLARAFGDMFMAMTRTAAMLIQVFMPVIQSLAIVFGGLARIVTAFQEAFMVILAGFLGVDIGFKDMVQWLTDKLVDFAKWIARGTVSLVAMVAKLVGATGMVENMRKAAAERGGPKKDTTGLANPTGANFTAAESFGKSIATASFTGTTAAAAPKKTDDFLDEIAKDMEQIADMDMKQIITDAITAAGPAIATAIANAGKGAIKAAGEVAYEWNPLKRPGEWLGEKVAGLLGH